MAATLHARWRGKWALVTGASSGIGAEFARQLAASGTHLVLTARRAERLQTLADKLRSEHKISVEICVADLEQPDAPDSIFRFTQDRKLQIDLLVNNAGFGSYGEFTELDPQREAAMVQVNCVAVVRLTHLFVKEMVGRRGGDVLILASTASFQPVPYISTYAATKVFDRYFAEALAEEVRPHGVHVCALCPGATKSEFFEVAEMPALSKAEPAETVVNRGLRAVAKGKSSIVSGFGNWFGTEIQRLAPRTLVTSMAGKMFRPKSNIQKVK